MTIAGSSNCSRSSNTGKTACKTEEEWPVFLWKAEGYSWNFLQSHWDFLVNYYCTAPTCGGWNIKKKRQWVSYWNFREGSAWDLHRPHQRGQRCVCWGRWIPEQSSCPPWQKTWRPWTAGMITPDKKKEEVCIHSTFLKHQIRTRGKWCLQAVARQATSDVTLRKLWAWEKSLLGWLLSYSFCSRTGMPCHLALLSLSCSKPPGSCSTQSR